MKFALSYENKTKVDPLITIVRALKTTYPGLEGIGHVTGDFLVLKNTVEFELNVIDNISIKNWMIKVCSEIEKVAYVRMYIVSSDAGNGNGSHSSELSKITDKLTKDGVIDPNPQIR